MTFPVYINVTCTTFLMMSVCIEPAQCNDILLKVLLVCCHVSTMLVLDLRCIHPTRSTSPLTVIMSTRWVVPDSVCSLALSFAAFFSLASLHDRSSASP